MTTITTQTAAEARREAARNKLNGQFGSQDHPEAGQVLDHADYGSVGHIGVGSRTPWGKADSVDHLADGVVFAGTPSHGGYKLSPERNKLIPDELRNSSGWYEEDAESHIVAAFMPDVFGRESHEKSVQALKDWYPHEFEAITGQKLTPADSYMLREEAKKADVVAFREANADNWVTTGSASSKICPEGYEAIRVERRSTGESKVLMVEKGFWKRTDGWTNVPVVVNPDACTDVTDLAERADEVYAKPEHSRTHDMGFTFDRLTSAASARAQKELNTRYRCEDGAIRTFRDVLAQQGAVGKRVAYFSGQTSATYFLDLGDSRIQPVSKAVYDAATGVPETMDDEDRAELAHSRASRAEDRTRKKLNSHQRFDSWDRDELRRAQAATLAAAEELRGIRTLRQAVANEQLRRLSEEAAARLGA